MKKSKLFTILISAIITLFLRTGLAFGEDALFIDGDGNVGIGTTTPDSELDVRKTTGSTITLGSSGNIAPDTNFGQIDFRHESSAYGDSVQPFARIAAVRKDYYALADLTFSTRYSTSTFLERMRITHTGNVGIGATNPTFSANARGLDIAGTGGIKDNPQDGTERIPTLRITDTVTDYGSGTATIGEKRGGIEFYSNESTSNFPAIASAIYDVNENTYNVVHGLAFYTNYNAASPTEAMRIGGNGNVGIGDTTPSQKLDVGGNVRADDFIEYSNIYIGDALSKIENITYEKGTENGDWADVDHSTLPKGLRVQTEETVWQNTKTNEKIYKGNPSENEIGDWIQTTEIVEGRSLGNSVQFNLQAIKQLLGKVLDAEDRVAELEAQIADLQKQLVELKNMN